MYKKEKESQYRRQNTDERDEELLVSKTIIIKEEELQIICGVWHWCFSLVSDSSYCVLWENEEGPKQDNMERAKEEARQQAFIAFLFYFQAECLFTVARSGGIGQGKCTHEVFGYE